MRKNLEKDEPDKKWTNHEILHWIEDNGVVDEAHHLSESDKQLQKSREPFKEIR